MAPFIQSAIGGGRGITDYRSRCAVNTTLRTDLNAQDDTEYRLSLMTNPRKAKMLRESYVIPSPYWETNRCPLQTNPPVDKVRF